MEAVKGALACSRCATGARTGHSASTPSLLSRRRREPRRLAAVGLALVVALAITPGLARGDQRLRCAAPEVEAPGSAGAAEFGAIAVGGVRRAVVIFARFADEPATPVPRWATDLFDPDVPGSFANYWDRASLGRLQVRGEVAPVRYAADLPTADYLARDGAAEGRFGLFVTDVLSQADADLDYSLFDADGADGLPNSGDDDGCVDVAFIVVARAPPGFLRGQATGISSLGLASDYITGDSSRAGSPVVVAVAGGCVLQGGEWPEAVGAMCHEYGHLLGLVDLYDTAFLRTPGVPPKDDSGGVGKWCLMGHGALGWRDGDGPANLGAFSRMLLGWSPVLEPVAAQEDVAVTPSATGGALVRIPVRPGEFYLLEYRARGRWWDRHLPGEGVLIWHVARLTVGDGVLGPWDVHVECADGRWLDSGYPAGRVPDPVGGEDNLGFWAHDQAYREGHLGNLGDATDPYDGEQFCAFTPETNPSSRGPDGSDGIRVEQITCKGASAQMRIATRPPALELRSWWVVGREPGAAIVVGQEVGLAVRIANTGGLTAQRGWARLCPPDSTVEAIAPEASFGDLEPGAETDARTPPVMRLRLRPGFVGKREVCLPIEWGAGNAPAAMGLARVPVLPPRLTVADLAVIDTAGNGDGRAQAGEFVGLSFRLEPACADAIAAFRFELTPTTTSARRVGGELGLVLGAGPTIEVDQSPEFILSAELAAGASVPFDLTTDDGVTCRHDTVTITIAPGGDHTAPRVGAFDVKVDATGVTICLPFDRVVDGGPIATAEARVGTATDTCHVTTVRMHPDDSGWVGVWSPTGPGDYLVGVAARDLAGNLGRTPWQRVSVPEAIAVLPDLPGHGPLPLGPRDSQWRPAIHAVCYDAETPGLVYLATDEALYRSADGGSTWRPTGLMMAPASGSPAAWRAFTGPKVWAGSGGGHEVYVAQGDPTTPELLRSEDAGARWQAVRGPWGPSHRAWFLGVDPSQPLRLFADDEGYLSVSSDGGRAWRRTPVRLREEQPNGSAASVFGHPAHPALIYAASLRGPGRALWVSMDDGVTWAARPLPRDLQELAADPAAPDQVIAVAGDRILRSADQGRQWSEWAVLPARLGGVAVHPQQHSLWVAWPQTAGGTGSRAGFWRSDDGGLSWRDLPSPMPNRDIAQIVYCPDAPREMLLSTRGYPWLGSRLWRSRDGGQAWTESQVLAAGPPVSCLAVPSGGSGGLLASSQVGSEEHRWQLCAIGNRGGSWEWTGQVPQDGGPAQLASLALTPNPTAVGIGVSGWGLLWRGRWPLGDWRGVDARYAASGASSGIRLSPQVSVDPMEPGRVYAATYTVLASDDGGAQWRAIDAGLPADPNRLLGGFALDPVDAGTLYAALGDQVWRSGSAAAGWARVTEPAPGAAVLALSASPGPEQRVWAATTAGLCSSEDRGRSWACRLRPEQGPWYEARIRCAARHGGWVCVSTGRQLYLTTDGGATWRTLGQCLPGLPWYTDVAADPEDGSAVYAATPCGLYRLGALATTVQPAERGAPSRPPTLRPNWPNPFSGSTTIAYGVPTAGPVSLVVYSALGQPVRVLATGPEAAGDHQRVWDGCSDSGQPVASGLYLLRLQAAEQVQVRRAVLLR